MQEDLQQLNARLSEISQRLFGGRLEVLVVDPRTIMATRKNARYMAKEVFDQLAANVKGDGGLHSVPLCHRLAEGRIEIISGNHRVKAAIEAGISEILIFCFPHELKPSRKRAIQLSHNAIVGQDDPQLLSELWREIEEIGDRLYSGLDSRVVGELTKVNFSGFSPEQVRTECVVLWFLPEEVEHFDALLDKLAETASARTVYMAPLAKYDALHKAIVAKKRRDNIKNTAVAVAQLIDEVTAMLAEKENAAK